MIISSADRSRLVALGLASAAICACSPEKAPDAGSAGKSAAVPPVASVAPPSSRDAASIDAKVSRQADTPAAGAMESRRSAPARAAPARPAPPAGPRPVFIGEVDLTGVGHDRGSASARVVMIDLSDFGCPYCAEFTRETYPAIEKEYVETGKVFFKYVPFLVGSFPHSGEATRATECAADQGGFWPMMKGVYEAQREWRKGPDPYTLLIGIASAAGLDSTRFATCYVSQRTDVRTARATGVASDLGVRVTPSFLVAGRPIQGALPLADFRKVIEAALLLSVMKK